VRSRHISLLYLFGLSWNEQLVEHPRASKSKPTLKLVINYGGALSQTVRASESSQR
jgi:hypothetical protein